MFCIIDGEKFHPFIKNMWIGDLGASCHISNDDTGLYNVIEINMLVQRNSGNMSATRKG